MEIKTIKINELMEKCFFYGVDYGQLLMEEERESEEAFDGFIGHCINKKYCAPSHPVERRQAHSEKWLKTKRDSFKKFQKLLIG